MVETGKGKVASDAPKLDVVLAAKAAQLSGVGVMQNKTGRRALDVVIYSLAT